MARGKAAAQNANRRTAEALERCAALQRTLETERADHAEAVQRLQEENRQLRATIQTAAETRASQMIDRAQHQAAKAIAQAEAKHAEQARQAVDVLHKWNTEYPTHGIDDKVILDVATALGARVFSAAQIQAEKVSFGLNELSPNRRRRRVTNKQERGVLGRTEKEVPKKLLLAEVQRRKQQNERDEDGQG